MKRSLERENDTAVVLAQQGYRVPIDGLKEVKAVTPDRRVVEIWYGREAG